MSIFFFRSSRAYFSSSPTYHHHLFNFYYIFLSTLKTLPFFMVRQWVTHYRPHIACIEIVLIGSFSISPPFLPCPSYLLYFRPPPQSLLFSSCLFSWFQRLFPITPLTQSLAHFSPPT